MNTKLVNVTDGAAVANFILTYLNSYSTHFPEFNNAMIGEKKNVRYNFTILCVKWFFAIAEVAYYDDRNEDSVKFGRRLQAALYEQSYSPKAIRAEKAPTELELNYRSQADVEKAIVSFLVCSNGDYDSFIRKMLYEHKTLEQNFSRFCVRWFEALIQENETSKSTEVVIAKKAMQLDPHFRYI